MSGQPSVAAIKPPTPTPAAPEVAAAKPARGNNRGRGGSRGGRGGRGGQSNTTSNSTSATPAQAKPNSGPRHATAQGENDKLCKIHYRWGVNANFCAGPWKCPMKDIFKAPQ